MAAPATTYEGPHYFDPRNPQDKGTTLGSVMSRRHTLDACFGVGPLEICATYRDVGIDFVIKLVGQQIGQGRLDQNNASAGIGVDLGLAKASVTLAADFSTRELRVSGEVCIRDWLGRWQCTGFNEVIMKW